MDIRYTYDCLNNNVYRESLGSVQYVCWLCGHDAFIAKMLWGHISHQQYYPAPAPAPPWQWPWAGAGGGHITCLIISSYIMLWLCGDWQPCSLSPVSTYTFRDIAKCLHWNIVLLPNANMWFQDFNWKTNWRKRKSMCSWHFKCTSEKQVILS